MPAVLTTPNPNGDTFLRWSQLAEHLSVSDDTLERYIRPAVLAGKIVSFKLGNCRLISWNSLLSYLERYHNGAL